MDLQAKDLVALMTALAETRDRAGAAGRTARALGAEDLMMLSRDPDSDAYLPVLGLRKTLPGGGQWQDFLQTLRTPGVHRGELPALHGNRVVPAVGCSAAGTAAVLLGGRVSDHDASALRSMLPLLGTALRSQQALAVASGELMAARNELKESDSLMRSLDEARREVDQTLIELDAQARSLHEARSRAEDATLAKDHFLAMLGHELRNPLSPIVTGLDLLRMRGVWSPEHDIIQRQVGHLLHLVDDLLDISRITRGHLTLEREAIEVAPVITRALEMTAPLLDLRAHQVHIDVPARGLCVSGDPARLAQVFSNLINNAAKYSNPGAPIRIAACQDGAQVRVEVADEGIGIDSHMLEAVFDLFEQQSHGLDRAQGGLGLGLAIVRSLVVQHGGQVRVSSQGQGRGSCFTVELPRLSDEVCERRALAPAAAARVPMRGRILLVDDNADAASTLAKALQASGFEVRTAGDGPEALRLATGFRADVALLDIGLPVMDGYELAGLLRELWGEPTRLVALTGYGQESDRLRARDAGFDAHLVKPVEWPLLERTLHGLLDGRDDVGGALSGSRRDGGDGRAS